MTATNPGKIDMAIVVASLLFIASFLLFWTFLDWAGSDVRPRRKMWRVTALRLVFALGAGLLPLLVLGRMAGRALPYPPSFRLSALQATVTLLAAAVAFSISYFAPKDERTVEFYPLIGHGPWSPLEWIVDGLGWLVYLGAYEYALRGYLPGLLVLAGLDFIPAAAIMIVIYAAGHVHKGPKEAWLCLPFGILLHASVAWTGTIAMAWMVHVALGLGNDAGILRQEGSTGPKAGQA
jgi:hypothetical protein